MKIKLIITSILLIFTLSKIYSQNIDYDNMKKNAKNIEYTVKPEIKNNQATFSVSITFPKNYFAETALVFVKPTITGIISYSSWENQKFVGENINDTQNADKVSYSSGGKFTFSRTTTLTSGNYGDINFNLSIYFNKDLLITFTETYSLSASGITEETETNTETTTENTEIENNVTENTDNEVTDTTKKADLSEIDDILEKIKINEKEKDYTELTTLHSDLGEIYVTNEEYDNAINSYRNAIDYSSKDGVTIETGDLYTDVGKVEFENNKNLEAISDYKEAIEIFTEKGDKERVELSYNNLATIYNSMLYYENSIEAYNEAIKNCDVSDKEKLAKYSSKIADAYSNMEKLQETAEYYEKTITYEKSSGNITELIASLNNISTVFIKLGQTDKANEYIEEAVELNETSGNEYNNAILLNNMASIYLKGKKYSLAIENYEKAAETSLNSNNYKSQAIAYYNLGIVYLEQKENEKAKENFDKSLEIAKSKNFGDIISKNYLRISKTIANNIDCQEDFETYQNFLSESNAFTEDDGSPILDIQDKYTADVSNEQLIAELSVKDVELKKLQEQNEKQELENKNLLIEKELTEEKNRRQKILIFVLTAGILIILFLAITAIRESMLKRKANIALQEKNAQILQQNEEIKAQSEEIIEQNRNIEEINKKITSSIIYAQNIQNAMLPSKTFMDSVLGDYFIYFNPRDIVSGDFYWVTEKNSEIIIVAADCTGHGVPGAMMSMLSMALFNEIVNDDNLAEPNQIVDKLRDLVIKSLNKNVNMDLEENQKITRDGMDLALIKLNKKSMKVKFTGAENPMIIVRNNELIEFEGDGMPVGASTLAITNTNFKMHEFDLQSNDMIYIFSDGYADQFGGPKKKKFFKRNLLNLFGEISQKNTAEQKEILEKTFNNWKGTYRQIDDVLVFGIRV